MRILLAHNSLYYPSHGGGDRSNRLLMEALAARGHEVRVAARIGKFGAGSHASFLEELSKRGIVPAIEAPFTQFLLNGVEVRTLTLNAQMRTFFARELQEFDPDAVITSTDDPAQLLLEIAVNAPRARVVHLVRATIAVPFGPDSSMASVARTTMLHRADRVVGVSEYVACYVHEYGKMDAVHVPISLMEPGDPQDVGRFDSPYVTLANPCAVKGIGIFLELAARMPHLRFAAVPTWGTNAEDLALLRKHSNIDILPPMDRIADLMNRTRVLLVPSVWAEARSRIVLEGMLHGVPVIASDIGGIPEAKLGVPYLIPVTPITRYEPALDENMVPVADVPAQDIGPWQDALERLTSDPVHWRQIATASRGAALAYVKKLSVEPFEQILLDVISCPKKASVQGAAPTLTADKQRLIALRLRQRSWFPLAEDARPGQIRLFCFPYAGAGTALYRGWSGQIGEAIAVCPVLLPGRESRVNEQPMENMLELIVALTAAIKIYVNQPFAFFGHSMGAGIAFELARSLRRNNFPLPQSLCVSAARAPQFRLEYTPGPEPTDTELLANLPDRAEARELALPLLRTDAGLYRRYRYTPEAPLDLPIHAYGGASDPHVQPGHLEAWREQTTAAFERRELAGGHFYLRDAPDAFIDAFRRDLQALVTGDS